MDDDAERAQEPDEVYEDADSDEPTSQPSIEPDVLLDVPQLKVDEITLDVEELRARVSLRAEVLDLLRLNVGADVALGGVHLDIKGVEAQALLKVRLDNVAEVIGRVLTTIDRNPRILEHVTSGLGTAAEELGSGAKRSVSELGRGAGEAVEDVGEHTGEAVEDVGESTGKVTDDLSDSVKDVTKEGVGQATEGAHEATEGADTRTRKSGDSSGRTVRRTPRGSGAARSGPRLRERAVRGGEATSRRSPRGREQERGAEGRPP